MRKIFPVAFTYNSHKLPLIFARQTLLYFTISRKRIEPHTNMMSLWIFRLSGHLFLRAFQSYLLYSISCYVSIVSISIDRERSRGTESQETGVADLSPCGK